MREISLAFGPNRSLVGTLTLPFSLNTSIVPALGLVLFNSGVVHRIGVHRINVKLARRLAKHGIPSIRFDLQGSGDSLRSEVGSDYEKQTVFDIRAAIDCLQFSTNIQSFAVLGFCSGGMPTFLAAHIDFRIQSIILFDAFDLQTKKQRVRFLWTRLRAHGMGLRALLLYLQRSARLATVPLNFIKLLFTHDLHATGNSHESKVVNRNFLTGLHQLADNGVNIIIMHAGGDFSSVNYEGQFKDAIHDLFVADKMHFHLLAASDHEVTSTSSQKIFIDFICTQLLGLPSHRMMESTNLEPLTSSPTPKDSHLA